MVLFGLVALCFLAQNQHRVELIRRDFVERNGNGEIEGALKIEGASDQQARIRGLRHFQPFEWTLARLVFAQCRVAEFLAAQSPVDEIAEGRMLRPLRI